MKKDCIFTEPKLEIILFDPEMDVIATSGGSINFADRIQYDNSRCDGLPLDELF